jgi:hypothetical protein
LRAGQFALLATTAATAAAEVTRTTPAEVAAAAAVDLAAHKVVRASQLQVVLLLKTKELPQTRVVSIKGNVFCVVRHHMDSPSASLPKTATRRKLRKNSLRREM